MSAVYGTRGTPGGKRHLKDAPDNYRNLRGSWFLGYQSTRRNNQRSRAEAERPKGLLAHEQKGRESLQPSDILCVIIAI